MKFGSIVAYTLAILAQLPVTVVLANNTIDTSTPQPLIILTGPSCDGPLIENPEDRPLKQIHIAGETYLTFRDHGVVRTVSLKQTLAHFPALLETLKNPILKSVERMAQKTSQESSVTRSAYLRIWPGLTTLENKIRDGKISIFFRNEKFLNAMRLTFSPESRKEVVAIELSHGGMNLLLELQKLNSLTTSGPQLSEPILIKTFGQSLAGLLYEIDFINESKHEPSVYDLHYAENQGSALFAHGPGTPAKDPTPELWSIVKRKIAADDIASLAWAFAPDLQQQLQKVGAGDTLFAARRRRDKLAEYTLMGEGIFKSFGLQLAKTEALQGKRRMLFQELGRAAAFYDFARTYFKGDRWDSYLLDATLAAKALETSEATFQYAHQILQEIAEHPL